MIEVHCDVFASFSLCSSSQPKLEIFHEIKQIVDKKWSFLSSKSVDSVQTFHTFSQQKRGKMIMSALEQGQQFS